jgi:hypothetical protein
MEETRSTVQNGKGDSPRNISKMFRDRYDEIDWGKKKKSKKKKKSQS